MPTATATFSSNVALGCALPPYAPHAISVSLPTWRDNVGYEEGDKRVVDKMVCGYPRFFIPLVVQKLANICEQKYSFNNEKCLLLPSRKIADECRSYIERRTEEVLGKKCLARCVEERSHHPHRQQHPYHHGLDSSNTKINSETDSGINQGPESLYIVLFHPDAHAIAKEFWQHTGLGVSSRFAERFLSIRFGPILEDGAAVGIGAGVGCGGGGGKRHHRHYSGKGASVFGYGYGYSFDTTTTTSRAARRRSGSIGGGATGTGKEEEAGELGADCQTYLEERYGRNLPLCVAASAKRALRRRLAGVLIKDSLGGDCVDAGEEVGSSSRVAEGDVYLFPSGMAAIWTAHQCLMGVRGLDAKSVCFGFTYTDTLKILQKWGRGCHFFGNGLDSDIDELEKILIDQGPILALFAEFPSNPLLRSVNLPRLRALADKYGFPIVVDETVGSIVNVEVIQYTDIVVSSLTKIFSGDANVMGGSLALNPQGKYYKALKDHLDSTFEDIYFDEDAIYLERNSRDFKRRIWRINANTEAVCDFLYSRSIAGGNTSPDTVIKQVFYPKYSTPENYERCRKKKGEDEEGGYGGLFSLTFTSRAASEAFFDALQCFKGPSLGTNFTLACPYTILAHYGELDWAAGFGVEAGLVRVSIGMEDKDDLLKLFEVALNAAQNQAQVEIR